ncbi:MAG: adenylate/guanylate cyclase domain-containing protein [Mariprofundaceae bacterium]
MSKIIVRSTSGEHTYTVGDEATIGRHPRCTICLHDPMISKRHAVIRHTEDGYIFEDRGSSNGSFLDGVRVSQHTLKDGDKINIGKASLTFQAESEAEKMARMVSISQVAEASQVQDRIEVASVENFLPEKDVADLGVLRVDYEKLRLGYDLLQNIGLERDLDSALEKVTEALIGVFFADRCAIMLIDPGTGELTPRSVRSQGGDDSSVSISGSILQEVRETKTAVLLSDASQDERFSQASSLIMQGIRSVMCAPILHNGEFLGVVHLDSQKMQSSFTRKDLQLLSGIVRYVAMAVANARLLHKVEEEAKTQAQFERLLSPSVVEQIMSGKITMEKGGELRDVTILFADIRGFTSMSRRSSATSIVAMLNSYFEIIVDIVFKYNGTVDKYIGDEIMVLFGAPVDVPRAADQAVACALEMQSAIEKFNHERESRGEEAIEIGIGVNSGEVVVGSIGSSQTMQYTCIGDAVNVASRLTGMAEAGQVMISEHTLEKMKTRANYEVVPPASLKGIEGDLKVYAIKELLADTRDPASPTSQGTPAA